MIYHTRRVKNVFLLFTFGTLLFVPDLLARGLVAAVPGRRLALARAVERAVAPRAALHLASFAA